MSDTPDESMPQLVILPRPQICVELDANDEIIITTLAISEDYKGLDHGDVRIPLESVREVAEAMLAILERRSR